MDARAPEQPLSTAEHDRDAYLEAALSLAALGVLLQIVIATFGAIALFGGCS